MTEKERAAFIAMTDKERAEFALMKAVDILTRRDEDQVLDFSDN